MGGVFVATNRQILLRRPQLLKGPIAPEAARRLLYFAALGQIPYVVAVALAVVSPYITLAICASTAVYYSLPIASLGGGGRSDADLA